MPHPPSYTHHIFCCTNRRPDGAKRGCCAAKDSERLRNYMKARAKELGIEGVRVNASGCLDKCEYGPAVVIYPEGVWYRYETMEDIDRILAEHIQGGTPVEELRMVIEDKGEG